MRFLRLAAVAALLAAPAAAQTHLPPAQEAVAHEAMIRLRSPVTPSHMLDMCPAAEAVALRDTIRMEVARGATTEQVVEGVVARYGERVRAYPKRSGFGLWAWLAPPLVLLAGAGVVTAAMRRLRGSLDDAPAPAGGMSDEDRARLDAAMRAFERGEAGA
jgi:cytochrome c-type biogenesis protein CcmH/NrfF